LIDVEPVTASIGAVVTGADLGGDLDDALVAELRGALLTHHVLFFRDQPLDDDQHLALAGRFGEVNRSPYADGFLEVLEDGPNSRPSADLWHTDMAFLERPPDIAVLSMRHAPPAGGDTLWANLFAVHDRLSPQLQEVVATMRQDVRRARPVPWLAGGEQGGVVYRPDPDAPGRTHPLVRTHPETGRKALFLCGQFVSGIVGLHPDESDAVLALLRGGLHDPNVQCRWRWRTDDVAIWDERCTNHRALSDHWPQRRVVRRCTVGASAVSSSS
jgi:taurine dioxygenase